MPRSTSRKNKQSDGDPAITAAQITSRRTLVGVVITAMVAGVATISAAVISKGCWTTSTPLFFTGRVINKNTEERIRGAKVSLEGESTPPLAYTDSEGIFSFPLNDSNKELRIRVEADQYENFDLRVTPAKNQGIQDLRLTPKTEKTTELSGIVFDANGKPLQGAKVTIDDIPGMQPVETSSDGVFILRDIPRKPGDSVRLRVVKGGYQPDPYTEDIVLGKSPPKIELTEKR